MCGGKGGTSTTNQSSQIQIPSNVLANYNQVFGMGQAAAAQPFQDYSGQFVAPVTTTQQGGINTIAGAQNWIPGTYSNATDTLRSGLASANPLYGTAAGLAGASIGAVNPSQIDAGAINQFMSPYIQSVVDPTTKWLNQQNALQQTALSSNAISQGAFGGDRSGIASAVLSGQQNMAEAPQIAGLYNQGYSQALAAAQQQQGVNLGAAQANRQALQTGSQLFGQTGNEFLNAGVTGGNAFNQFGTQALQSQLAAGQGLLGAGTVEQQTQQAQDTALYNQFLQQQAYPFQTTQFLGNLAMGMGPLYGSTTTQQGSQFAPQPFFSDDKLKENVRKIGRTRDGLHIIRYNYKDDPHKLLRIGFLASDVEKKMPEAVSKHDGIRSVDYERAARARGGRSGYDDGGVINSFDPMPNQAVADDSGIFHDAAGNAVQPRQDTGDRVTKWMPDDIQVGTGEAPAPATLTQRPLYRGIQPTDHRNAAAMFSGPIPLGQARGGVVNDNWESMGGFVDPATHMRAAFAEGGGGPGFDPATMAAILAAQQAMYPGAAGRPGIGGSGPRGVELSQGNHPQLMKAQIQEMRQKEQQPELAQDLKAAGDLSKTSKDVGSLYDTGKDALVGSAAKGAIGSSGYTPATGGLVGTGGNWDWNSGWLGQKTAGLTGGATTPVPLDLAPTDSGSWNGMRRGGRLKRVAGGFAGSGSIPYDDTGGYVPVADYQPFPNSSLGQQQRLNASSSPGSGGSSGSGGGILGSISGLANLDKLGAQGISGLSSLFGSGGVGADGLPLSGLGAVTGDAAAGAAGAVGVADAGGGIGADALMGLFALKRGGRAGYQYGGGPDDDTQVAEAPSTPGLVVPQRGDNVVPLVRNPERPAAREREDKAYVEPDWAKRPEIRPEDIPAPTTSGVVPPPAAAPAVGPLPGVASSTTAPAPTSTTGGSTAHNIGGVMAPDGTLQRPPTFNHGVALAVHTAQGYPATYNQGKPMTIAEIGAHWAPVGAGNDPTNLNKNWVPNVTTAYREAGFDPDKPVDFSDPNQAAAYARAVHSAEQGTKLNLDAYRPGVAMANDPDVVRGFPGSGGGGTQQAANVPAGAGAGQPQPTTSGLVPGAPPTPPDWWDRNEKYVIPALSFLGNMLASPSRTLAGSIGSGMVGAAKALPQQQEIGQGQQRIDITQRSQNIGLYQSALQMWRASILPGKPDGDPVLKANVLRAAQAAGVPAPIGGAPGSPDSTAGGSTPGLVPTTSPTAGAGVAPAPAAPPPSVSASPLPAPPTMPAPVPAAPPQGARRPSMQIAEPAFTPEFENGLPPTSRPTALIAAGQAKMAAGDPTGQAMVNQGNQLKAQIVDAKGAIGEDGKWHDLPGAREFAQANERAADNNAWQVKNAPNVQARSVLRQNVSEIAHQLETFEPGEFANVKADIQAAARAFGLGQPYNPGHGMGTMDATAYQIFLKNAASIVTNTASTGSEHTDEARRLLADAFTGPNKQPGAVRDVLAKTLGNLDYDDKYFNDINKDIHAEPRLDRGMRTTEFDKENPRQKFIDDQYKKLAVAGDVPATRDGLKEDHQYILRPNEAIKLFAGQKKSDGTPLSPAEIKQKLFGDRNTVRVVIKNGVPVPVQ